MNDLPRTLKIATVWMVLGTAVFLGVQAFESQRQRMRFVAADGVIELRRARSASAAGSAVVVAPVSTRKSATAGGVAVGYVARADVVLDGNVRADRLRVTVLPALEAPLLGMDVLSKMRFEQHGGTLRLRPGAAP